MTTATYEVPTIEDPQPQLPNWGEHTGTVLLELVLTGNGDGITTFLAEFAERTNEQYRAENRRNDVAATMLDLITKTLVPQIRLTGFKAHANPDPKTRYNRPHVTNEGEGCECPSCDLAAKYRLPAPPEGMTYANWTLVCQKHAVQALDAHAHEVVDPKGRGRIYLSSARTRMINDETRKALKTVKA